MSSSLGCCIISTLQAGAFGSLRSLSGALLLSYPTGQSLKWLASSSRSTSTSSSSNNNSGTQEQPWQRNAALAAGEAQHDPAAPKSAAESYAAVQQEQLAKLQGLGLNLPAARAVHEAWAEGRLRAFTSDASLHVQRGSQQPVSPRRPLVGIRQLLAAHKAAAAAAVVPGSEAAANPAGDAPAGGQLSWADLDIQRLLMLDPRLLLVCHDDLAQRLNVLLNGIAPILGRDLALSFVHKAPTLRLLLEDPQASVQQLCERRNVYVAVLGVPPRPALLAASESSHSRLPVHTFKEKLEHFVQKWGAEAAHATLSSQPHLLASAMASLDTNSEGLQKLLGCTQQQLQRFVRKVPRVLSTDYHRLASNLVELTGLLQPLGLNPGDVRKLVLKHPNMLLASPITTAQKLQSVRELLGDAGKRLRYIITQNPCILSSSTQTLAERFEGLQRLLDCDAATVGSIIAKAPGVASIELDNIASKLQEYTSVLGMPLQQVKALCCSCPTLLLLRPEHVSAKLDLYADTLQADRSAVIDTIMVQPVLAVYDAELVAAHTRMLRVLVARSSRWMAIRSKYNARQRKSRQQQPPEKQQRDLPLTWPLLYSTTCSGRLLLRLEYVLATGQDEQVSLTVAQRQSDAQWVATFPDFHSWVQLRIQHLQQDSCEWPPVLLQKAAKWAAANCSKHPAGPAVAGRRSRGGS